MGAEMLRCPFAAQVLRFAQDDIASAHTLSMTRPVLVVKTHYKLILEEASLEKL
jgi:hypothetical protein